MKTKQNRAGLLDEYRQLLEEIDSWFDSCVQQFPTQIACSRGCSACCRGLFEISLLDAALLQQGFAQLEQQTRQLAIQKAEARRHQLLLQWPDLQQPYILNRLPHNDWEEMPEDDPTPCPLLGDQGACLIYHHRPMLCRLHGLPNIDASGELFQADYCTLNFSDQDATRKRELRHPFRDLYNREFDLLRQFAATLDEETIELDTFIPLALLIDFPVVNSKE